MDELSIQRLIFLHILAFTAGICAWYAFRKKGKPGIQPGTGEDTRTRHKKRRKRKPKNWLSWGTHAQSLFDEGNYEEALASYTNALELSPGEPGTAWGDAVNSLGKGKCLVKLRRYKESLTYLDEALRFFQEHDKDRQYLSEAALCRDVAVNNLNDTNGS